MSAKDAYRAIFVSDLTRAIYEMEHIQRTAIAFGIAWDAALAKKLLYELQEKVAADETHRNAV